MRFFLFFLSANFLSLSLVAQSSADKITFEQYLKFVDESHPEKVINDLDLKRAQKMAERQGILSDPEISIGRDEVPFKNKFQPEKEMAKEAKDSAQWQLRLTQTFPWPGTLSAEEKVGEKRRQSVEIKNSLLDQQRKFQAIELFLEMVEAEQILNFERANLKVIDGLSSLIHERFKQGLASHFEFLGAHSEVALAKINVSSLETDLNNLKKHAAFLMNNREGISKPESVNFALEWPDSLFSLEGKNSELKDLSLSEINNTRDLDLARQDSERQKSLPNFMASGMLMEEDSGMRMYGAMLGFSLPLYSYSQRRALESETTILKRQTDERLQWYEGRKNLALSQTQSRIDQLKQNEKAVEEDIIPPIKEHLEALTRQFSQGKSQIKEVLEARRMLLNMEIARVRAKKELGLEYLSLQKIQSGMVDEGLDQKVPRIYNSFMNSSAMAPMADKDSMRSDSMRSMKPKQDKRPELRPQSTDEEPDQNSQSGMGM